MKNLEINFVQFGAWEDFKIINFIYIFIIYRFFIFGPFIFIFFLPWAELLLSFINWANYIFTFFGAGFVISFFFFFFKFGNLLNPNFNHYLKVSLFF